jgi:hypothetical protein
MRPRTLAIAVVAGAALGLTAAAVNAQQPNSAPPPRHGLWIALGFGGGQVERWSDQGSATRQTTVTVSLRGGIVVVPALRLGIEANGWGLESGNIDDPAKGVTVNETMLIAQVYPWPARNLYVKGGFGRGEFHTMHADDWGSSAWGATVVGVGYDLRVAPNVFLTLAADWARGPLGSADPRVTTSTGRRFRGWTAIVGIQYH